MPSKLTDKDYKARLKENRKGALIAIEPFDGMKTPILHKCTLCGKEMLLIPQCASSKSTGLPLCCHQKPTTESYEKELIAVHSSMRPIEPYMGRWKKTLHRCLDCRTERNVMPKHLLRGHGCVVCAKDVVQNTKYKKKKVKSGGVVHYLQGFEPQALDYMISLGANPEYIVSSVKKGKPSFTYVFQNKKRTYIPDFYHTSKNRIIEVKSTWTLGLSNRTDEGPLLNNQAKAKAVIAKGFEFKLLVMDKKGKRIRIPKNWYELSKEQIMTYIKQNRGYYA